MNNQLMIFEGQELEILTKEDVNIEFDGTVLFNGKQTGTLLNYKNPSESIRVNVREKDKYLIKNANILESTYNGFRKLNNAGETFITEKGVMKLIINSSMPKAEEFEDKVWEIVTKVQQTGKFDTIENKIQKIEDIEERKLTLSLYSLEQVLKVNPNDMLTIINYKQTKQELDTYKQQKQLEKTQEEIELLKNNIDNIKNDTDLIKKQQVYICNRTNFNERVKILSNKYFGRDMQEAYNKLFKTMLLLGSFDVFVHRKHEWEALNAERAKEGKKPYKTSTLKQKVNYLDVIDKFNKWELCSEAYKTIETEMAI